MGRPSWLRMAMHLAHLRKVHGVRRAWPFRAHRLDPWTTYLLERGCSDPLHRIVHHPPSITVKDYFVGLHELGHVVCGHSHPHCSETIHETYLQIEVEADEWALANILPGLEEDGRQQVKWHLGAQFRDLVQLQHHLEVSMLDFLPPAQHRYWKLCDFPRDVAETIMMVSYPNSALRHEAGARFLHGLVRAGIATRTEPVAPMPPAALPEPIMPDRFPDPSLAPSWSLIFDPEDINANGDTVRVHQCSPDLAPSVKDYICKTYGRIPINGGPRPFLLIDPGGSMMGSEMVSVTVDKGPLPFAVACFIETIPELLDVLAKAEPKRYEEIDCVRFGSWPNIVVVLRPEEHAQLIELLSAVKVPELPELPEGPIEAIEHDPIPGVDDDDWPVPEPGVVRSCPGSWEEA